MTTIVRRNVHEPAQEDKRSRAWLFIYRGAPYSRLPEAFVPHVNFCAWISTYQSLGSYLLRGYIQTINPRNYYTLKTRYCKNCEWIPVSHTHQSIFEEFTSRALPLRSTRYIHGVPLGVFPVHQTVPLQKVGYNIEVPDLIEDYISVLFMEDYPVEDVVPPVFDFDTWEEQQRVANLDIDFVNPNTGQVMGGRYNGYRF